jgi:hypothetical protein
MTPSDLVARATVATFPTSTMRTAVTMSTPARAASGISATSPDPTNTTAISTSEWTIEATRVWAPALTFTAVRAIAPVAGTPPNSGTIMLARPWPISSRLGSCRPTPAIPSATLADSRLSSAARAATASTAPNRSETTPASNAGNEGVGSDDGKAPITPTSAPPSRATMVAATTARSEAGIPRWMRGTPTMMATTSATRPKAHHIPPPPTASPTARTATAAVFSPSGLGTPRAAGTCCRKMMTAIPRVNPSITGQGMNAR